ncbi:MAG: PAS domain-containing protein [Thermodesulfobacteriota bacterium]
MAWLLPALIASFSGSLVLVGMFFYLHARYRDGSLRLWAWSWVVYTCRFLFMLFLLQWPASPLHALFETLHLNCVSWSSIMLLAGVQIFLGRAPWTTSLLVLGILLSAWTAVASFHHLGFFAANLPVFFLSGVINILAGRMFLLQKDLPATGRVVTGGVLILWGLHKFNYPFLRPVEWFAPWGYLAGAVFSFIVALGILLIFFERERQNLARSEERLAVAVDGAELGIWDWQPVSGSVSFNDHWYTMLGYAPGELPASYQTWAELLHPDDRQETEATVEEQVRRPDGRWELTFRLRGRDGVYHWILGRGRIVEWDAATGFARRAAGTHLDISRRMKAIAALRDSEEKYRSLTVNLPNIVYRVHSREGGRIEFFNDSLQAITGYRDEELPAAGLCPMLGLMLPEDRGAAEREITAAVAERRPFTLEYRLRHKDGTLRNLQERGRPIFTAQDELVYLDGIILDCTELKKALAEKEKVEQQFRQAQKMEAIGTLAGGIAHEFNNILSAIVGYTELALYSNRLDGENRTNMEEVLRASFRARDLVGQILAFSRQQPHDLKVLSPAPVVKEIVKMLRSSVPTSIAITAEIAEDVRQIHADPAMLHQLVMNLAVNAVQAMNGRGEMRIGLANVTVSAEEAAANHRGKAGDHVRLVVADNGIGMEREIMERIFEPFFTTRKTGEGTGMGLSEVYGIVQRHGGFLSVESSPGNGARFEIFLPVAEKGRAADGVLASSIAMPGGSERILLVDDEEAIVDSSRRLLQYLGYSVTGLTSSSAAWDLFAGDPAAFDLLITDQTMPELSGTELAARVVARRPGLPVILVSGYNEDASWTEGDDDDAPIHTRLAKPVRRERLALAVRNALDGARRSGPAVD